MYFDQKTGKYCEGDAPNLVHTNYHAPKVFVPTPAGSVLSTTPGVVVNDGSGRHLKPRSKRKVKK